MFVERRVPLGAIVIVLVGCVCAFGGAPMREVDDTPPTPEPVLLETGEGKHATFCSHAHAVDLTHPPGGPRGGEASDTDVTHYLLAITITPEYESGDVSAVGIAGRSTISVSSKVPALSTFVVNLANDMTVSDVTGNVTSWAHVGDEVQITLDRDYGVDEAFVVSVLYSGYPDTGGFGAFSWWERGDDLVIATLSEPYFARFWWPCKDVLGDKATMQMHCTVPIGLVVVSNGIAEPPVPISLDEVLYKWHEINPMAPYLASLAISNYQRYDLTFEYDDGASTMPVPCYVYSDHWDGTLGQPRPAYKAGCDELPGMLDTLTGLYGPYPFLNEKYGVVETGGTGGLGASMEHQTISSMNRVDNFSDIMCHELAHQWWGDDVTCATWYDIWLNEGFASYSESLYRELKAGGGANAYWSRVNARRPWNPDAQVYRTSISSVGAIFSGNDVYNKGSWVLHMLRHVMGTEAFLDAAAYYRDQFSGGFATTAQFTTAFSTSFGHDLSWFVDEWVMNPGSPDYQWNWEAAELDGQHYVKLFIHQSQDGEGYGLCTMPIDIRVTTIGGAEVHRVWNDDWHENYVLPVSGPATDVQFDADGGVADRNWILFDTLTESVSAVDGPPVIVSADIEPLHGGTDDTRVHLVFSEDIGHLDPDDIVLIGSETGSHAFTSRYYTAATHVAEITYLGLPNDTYTLTMVGDTILANGQMLDGEVDDSAWWDSMLLPSGDGQPGGDAVFSFDIFAGDADCSGLVDIDDVDTFVAVLLGMDGDSCHILRSDMDNSGNVDGIDIQAFVGVLVD